ncbi:MAG: hypothetical protein PHS48_02845 [Bacteroidales bacterium]|nr:hypothetical protein [Bacteroidales bacterium]
MRENLINPKEDLQAIRQMMEQSSKFLSLSGLSGIFAGVCALIGATVAWSILPGSGNISYDAYPGSITWPLSKTTITLGMDALLVLLTASLGAFYFSFRKAQKAKVKFWTHSTRRLLGQLLIPLISGGVFTLILIFRNQAELVAPVMLIFYGLSLVHAGKYTLGEIHYLGLFEIILGLLAAIFVQYGLLFWAIGFGVLHIIYGAVMYYRHEG